MPSTPDFYTVPLPDSPNVYCHSPIGQFTFEHSDRTLTVYIVQNQVLLYYQGNPGHEWFLQPNCRILLSVADLLDIEPERIAHNFTSSMQMQQWSEFEGDCVTMKLNL